MTGVQTCALPISQFDLAEVNARELRSELLQYSKLTKRICNKIESKCLEKCSTQFYQFDKETNLGRDLIKLKEWQVFIISELNRLNEFASRE